MAKPRIHIFCRSSVLQVPLFTDGPAVRDRFDVTRGPSIPKPWPDLVVYETDHVMAINISHPYVLVVSGFWPKESTHRSKRRQITRAMVKARSVICASKFLKRQVQVNFKARRAMALPGGLWGTDHVRFKVNPARFKPKAHYHQHRKGPLVVMSISLAAEIKWRGVELFLGAADEVLRQHNARVVCRAMVRGRGDLVKQWGEQYGLEFSQWKRGDGFDFTKGLGDTGWPKLLRRADLFVHPSTWDAWGCVVADAMFSAVPSLVFEGTGSAEISDVAVKVPPNNAARITTAVDRLLSSTPAEREEYGNALRVEAMKKNEKHRGDIADALQAALEGKA